MNRKVATLGILALALAGTMFAAEGPVPKGVPHLDHVFVIMMENHGYSQLLRHWAPQLNQLSGTRRRIELRRAQR